MLLPLVSVVLCAVYVIMAAVPRPAGGTAANDAVAKLPVSFDGRIEPFDTLARNVLKVMRGGSALMIVPGPDGKPKTTEVDPVVWLLDLGVAAVGRQTVQDVRDRPS